MFVYDRKRLVLCLNDEISQKRLKDNDLDDEYNKSDDIMDNNSLKKKKLNIYNIFKRFS